MARYDETDIKTKRLLNEIQAKLSDATTKQLDEYSQELIGTVEQLGIQIAGWELMVLEGWTGLKLNLPDTKAIVYAIQNRPLSVRNFNGDLLLRPFIESMSVATKSAINNAVLQAWSEGQPLSQLLQRIRGTRKAGYADGILGQYVRNADAIARTAIQHSASVGRMALWKANADIAHGYRIRATLDSHTTERCRGLDESKEVFDFGKGPLPPLHFRCRDTTELVLKDETFTEGQTRSSGEKITIDDDGRKFVVDNRGYVDAKKGYYSWLLDQPAKYQDLAIGKTRAALLRNGGLSAERFAKLSLDKNFEPLTLAEMRQQVPDAFKRAGL